MHFRRLGLALASLMFSPLTQAADAADYARRPDFTEVKISPDGTYIGVVGDVDGDPGLIVVRIADKQVTGRFGLGPNSAVEDYWWVGPNRLVVSSALQFGSLDTPRRIGELIGVDADGKNRTYLLGYRAPIGRLRPVGNTGRHYDLRGKIDVAEMVDPAPYDPQHAIISLHEVGSQREPDNARAYLLDVTNGVRELITTAPIASNGRFLTDRNGSVRYFVGKDGHGKVQTFARAPGDSDWTLVNTGALEQAVVEPIAFGDADTVYLSSDEKDGFHCLYRQDLKSGQKAELSCDEQTDLTRTLMSFDRSHPIATLYASIKPELRYLDSEDPDRILLEKFQNSFPGEIVLPTSATLDGSKLILHVYSDRDPGRFFLFDRTTGKATFLLAVRAWADPKTMAERQPIEYAARDGQIIHGFLTLPPGKEARNLPMVVLPHGGPFGIRDAWHWDEDAEWLAANGYAVLQPNFRGSGGFGSTFYNAGRKGWNSVMIDDITDATRWAVKQGIADEHRLAIFGGSYGGYAALMSTLREPDLYRCVIDYAGVSDLKAWRKETDVSETRAGRSYIEEFVGADDASLAAASPLTLIDRLKVPVLIIHGKEDARVPFSQATELRKALDERKLPYEWLVKDGEGHGFRKPENREELLTKIVAFLDLNLLGPTSAAQ